MVTKKTTSSAKKSPRKAASSQTRATSTKVTTVNANVSKKSTSQRGKWSDNIANIIVAEIVGTFILTAVALFAVQLVSPLYVGLAYAVIVFAVGAVSGAHVNPAVTFAMWTMRRLKLALVPVYWVAQLLGAVLAVVTMSTLSASRLSLDLGHFGSMDWSIFGVELVGTAVFLFGLTAVLLRNDIQATGKALGVGLSLTIGLVVASTMLTAVTSGVDQTKIKQDVDQTTGSVKLSNVPHVLNVNGALLNPAVALASTEKTNSELTGGQAADDEARYSRLSLEVILGTLVGAALGGNLYLLVASRLRS